MPQRADRMQKALDQALAVTSSLPLDEESYWSAVQGLWRQKPRELFEALKPFASRADARLRVLVSDGLRCMGGVKDKVLRGQASKLFHRMLGREKDPFVLAALLSANESFRDPEIAEKALEHIHHPDVRVRRGALESFLGRRDGWAIAALIELSSDQDETIRHWATVGLAFKLGWRSDADGIMDTPEIREALWRRTRESATSATALVGLALRRDLRVLPTLQSRLADPSTDWTERREELDDCLCAANLLGHGDLLEPLMRLLDRAGEVYLETIGEAIEACQKGGALP